MALTEDDIRAAMEAVPAYIDITSADFREIYHLAFEHALKRLSEAIRVRNLLQQGVVTVKPDTPLPEVTALMIQHRISGVPVVDDAGCVAGIVSEHDFVTHAREEGGRTVIEILPSGDSSSGAGAGHAYAHVAADIMTRDVVTLDEDTPLPEIAARFHERKVNRLPVTDSAGHLVGIVARWDLVQSVLAAFVDPETP
jgi:CBS-domain-containing membrane protein